MDTLNRLRVIFLFGLFLSLPVLGQGDDSEDFDPDQLEIYSNSDSDSIVTVFSVMSKEKKEKKWDTGLNVGASFNYSPGNFYGPSYFVSPSLTYKVHPRFYLSAGIAMEYSTLYPVNQNPATENQMLPMTRLFLHASGTYLVNQRLSVSGTVYKAIDYVPNLNNYSGHNFDSQGFSMGVNYKITQNFSFGIHVRVQDGPGSGYGTGLGYGPGYGTNSGYGSFNSGYGSMFGPGW